MSRPIVFALLTLGGAIFGAALPASAGMLLPANPKVVLDMRRHAGGWGGPSGRPFGPWLGHVSPKGVPDVKPHGAGGGCGPAALCMGPSNPGWSLPSGHPHSTGNPF